MRVILVTLALLLLVVLNEGLSLTPAKIPTKLILKKPEVTKSCPRNPKLEAMRKALGLATKRRSGRGKRSISSFPISCLHVAIVEFEDGLQYLQPLYDCCDECYFPDYASCIWNGNPSWLCASRAYKCICDCREAQLVEHEDVTLKKSSFKVRSEKKVLTSASVCKKKSCSYGDKGCCVEDQCIKLYVHKTKSPVRQK
ncbi:Hypothetical predicted protein [Paramuricea clavata]|uniref:Uncharacterized protein n=1 Tax=Paramuricea clavata TaxID=317549 RepID=A0A7D9IGE8_PARCT|nr:Hypothetical predicted protein [Paramuricea clavata]